MYRKRLLFAVLLSFLQPLSHRRQTAVTAPLTQGSHFPHFVYSLKRPGSRRGASLKTQNANLKTVYRHTSSPSCTSTVMVLPALRSPRRMVRASRVSTLLCSVRRRGLAP